MTVRTTEANVKNSIHDRVDALSGIDALRVLEFIDMLEEDYDPLTEDELAQIEASEADIAAGRVSSWDEVKSRLAALP